MNRVEKQRKLLEKEQLDQKVDDVIFSLKPTPFPSQKEKQLR
jgi:hypothetical protein